MMADLVRLLPASSAVVVSHVASPDDEDHAAAAARIGEMLHEGGMPIAFRHPQMIERLLNPTGTGEVLEPGVVRICDWWPSGPPDRIEPWDYLLYGGVARV